MSRQGVEVWRGNFGASSADGAGSIEPNWRDRGKSYQTRSVNLRNKMSTSKCTKVHELYLHFRDRTYTLRCSARDTVSLYK
jgi:hypothetical protein